MENKSSPTKENNLTPQRFGNPNGSFYNLKSTAKSHNATGSRSTARNRTATNCEEARLSGRIQRRHSKLSPLAKLLKRAAFCFIGELARIPRNCNVRDCSGSIYQDWCITIRFIDAETHRLHPRFEQLHSRRTPIDLPRRADGDRTERTTDVSCAADDGFKFTD